MQRLAILCTVVLFLPAGSTPQTAAQPKPLSNQDVVEMMKENIAESIILKMIGTGNVAFDISREGVIALTKSGVNEKIVNAIIEAQAKQQNALNLDGTVLKPSAETGTAGDANLPQKLPAEPGVYFRSREAWVRLEQGNPGIKMTGLLKGNINPFSKVSNRYAFPGAAALIQITEPKPIFYIRGPEISPSVVRLVSLECKKNSREVEYGSTSAFRGIRFGPKPEKLVETTASRVSADVVKVVPTKDLVRGEYAIDMGGVPSHDFGIAVAGKASK